MTSLNKMVFTGVAALALSVTSAFGQGSFAKYNVPFAFEATGQSMPAAEYTVRNNSHNTLQVSAAGGPQILLLDTQGSSTRDTESGKLVFHKYGNQYFLAGIAQPGSAHVTRVSPSKREKEIKMAAGVQADHVVIAAE
jgi:hypothetical protein